MGSGRSPTEIPNVQYFIHGNGDTRPPQLSHQPGKTPSAGKVDGISNPSLLPGPSQQSLGMELPEEKVHRVKTQQMPLPRGGIRGAPTTTSAIMESQIKKIKSHASGHGLMSPRVRKEFLSPYTAVHNWVSALAGATSPGLFFPSPFGSPWHKSCV